MATLSLDKRAKILILSSISSVSIAVIFTIYHMINTKDNQLSA